MRMIAGIFLVQCLLALKPADGPDASAFNGAWRQQITAKAAASRNTEREAFGEIGIQTPYPRLNLSVGKSVEDLR